MKKILIIIMIMSMTMLKAQTSISKEIYINTTPADSYVLRNGDAKKIIVTETYNPNDSDKFIDVWTYDFQNHQLVRAKLIRDDVLTITEYFTLDSLNRIKKMRKRFKHRSIGWERTNIEYVFRKIKKR